VTRKKIPVLSRKALEDAGTQILKQSVIECREGPMVVDYLNKHDSEKRERRRVTLLAKNKVLAEPYISTRNHPSSEDLLSEKQNIAQFRVLLRKLFETVDHDISSKRVLIACLREGIPLRDTKRLSE